MKPKQLILSIFSILLAVSTLIQPVSADTADNEASKVSSALAESIIQVDGIGGGSGSSGGTGSGAMHTSQTGYRFYLAKSNGTSLDVVSNIIDVNYNNSAQRYYPNGTTSELWVETRLGIKGKTNPTTGQTTSYKSDATIITISELGIKLPQPVYHDGSFHGNGEEFRSWMDSVHTTDCLGYYDYDNYTANRTTGMVQNTTKQTQQALLNSIRTSVYNTMVEHAFYMINTKPPKGSGFNENQSMFTGAQAKQALIDGLEQAQQRLTSSSVADKVLEGLKSDASDIISNAPKSVQCTTDGWQTPPLTPKPTTSTTKKPLGGQNTVASAPFTSNNPDILFAHADGTCAGECYGSSDVALNSVRLIAHLAVNGLTVNGSKREVTVDDMVQNNYILMVEPIVWFEMDNEEVFYGTPTEFAELYAKDNSIDGNHTTAMFKTYSVSLFLDEAVSQNWCETGEQGGTTYFAPASYITFTKNDSPNKGLSALQNYSEGYAMHAYRFDGNLTDKAYILEFNTVYDENMEVAYSWSSELEEVDAGSIEIEAAKLVPIFSTKRTGYSMNEYAKYSSEFIELHNAKSVIEGYINDVNNSQVSAYFINLAIRVGAFQKDVYSYRENLSGDGKVKVELAPGELLVINRVYGYGGAIIAEYYGSYTGTPSNTYSDNEPTFWTIRTIPAEQLVTSGIDYTIGDVKVEGGTISGSDLEIDGKNLERTVYKQVESGEYTAREYFVFSGNYSGAGDYIKHKEHGESISPAELEEGIADYDNIKAYGKSKNAEVVNLKDPALDQSKRTVTFEEFELGESNVQTLVVLYLKEDKPEIDLIEFTEDYTTEPFTFDSTHSEIEWEKDKKYDITNDGDFLVEEYFLINKPKDALGWTTISFC